MLTGDILRLSAERHPNRTALICGEEKISYKVLNEAANRFGHALLQMGIGKGAKWAIMSRNLPEYVIAHFGGAQTGSLIVNLLPAYAPDELVTILAQTKVKLIVIEEIFQEKLSKIIGQLPELEHIIVIGETEQKGWVNFDRFTTEHPNTPCNIELSETEPFAMTFTGGTTGLPKGTMVSHQARYTSSYTTAIEHGITEADVVSMVTPFYHTMGSLVWLPAAMLVGATAVLLTGWDPDTFVEQTAKHSISSTFMVPVQLRQILSDKHFNGGQLLSLSNIACGGAVVPVDLVTEVNLKMPHARFTNHYGQSETGPICIYHSFHPREKANTIGRIALGVDLKIVNPSGQEVGVEETGEIICRGPFLMSGYYNNEQETNTYFANGDGWGWTGDLAKKDGDGFITLVGRSKDMIISGGVNIYPREVEIVLERLDEIIDCTVFGIPDDKWGEALVTYVVLDQNSLLDKKAIINHCTAHLARFKRPKHIRIVDNIEKTPSGKVQKPILRENFLRENKAAD